MDYFRDRKERVGELIFREKTDGLSTDKKVELDLYLQLEHLMRLVKARASHPEEHYRKIVALLDGLIDEVGEDESHPLASLMDIPGTLIERYEDEHVPELDNN